MSNRLLVPKDKRLILPSRRRFLAGILAAPAIIRPENAWSNLLLQGSGRSVASAGGALLLDSMPAPTYVWSTTKELTAYAGNCVTAWDGTTTHAYGFTSGNLNIADIQAHFPSDDVYTKIAHDQSGFGFDFSQTFGPGLLASGASVGNINGFAAMSGGHFDVGPTSTQVLAATAYTMIVVNQPDAVGPDNTDAINGLGFMGDDQDRIYFSAGSTKFIGGHYDGADKVAASVNTYSTGQNLIGVLRFGSGSLKVWCKGGASTGGATVTSVGNVTSVGSSSMKMLKIESDFSGLTSFMALWKVTLSLIDINTICAALATRYSATWTTAT